MDSNWCEFVKTRVRLVKYTCISLLNWPQYSIVCTFWSGFQIRPYNHCIPPSLPDRCKLGWPTRSLKFSQTYVGWTGLYAPSFWQLHMFVFMHPCTIYWNRCNETLNIFFSENKSTLKPVSIITWLKRVMTSWTFIGWRHNSKPSSDQHTRGRVNTFLFRIFVEDNCHQVFKNLETTNMCYTRPHLTVLNYSVGENVHLTRITYIKTNYNY